MSALAISLLGSFSVSLDDTPPITFPTDKVRALLAYLVVEVDRAHRRESLADLLWPDKAVSAARNCLRQALFQLRKSLADSERPVQYLLVSTKEIRFNLLSDYWLDVVELEISLSAARAHLRMGQDLCPDCQARLETASRLYRGDFMEGFSLPDCPQFSWWRFVNQEAIRRKALEALAILAHTLESQQAYEQVSGCVCRQIALEPLHEPAYRRYMRVLALNGDRNEALHQYDIYRQLLDAEIGIEPSAETTSLYQQIRAGRLPEPN
ncbi:MAG: BTAD domain-containing putative transcriptional regulator [Candidatus Promineifilaceae bacterium]